MCAYLRRGVYTEKENNQMAQNGSGWTEAAR